MTFTENFHVFLNDDEFATSVRIKDQVVKGLVGRVHVTVESVNSHQLTLTCAARDLPELAFGDHVIMDHQDYEIIALKPDGTGLMTLGLMRV